MSECSDYSIKKYILDNDILKEYNKISKLMYIMSNVPGSSVSFFDNIKSEFINKYGFQVYNYCSKLKNSYYHKRSRVSDYIWAMVNYAPCVFLTLTFDDDALNLTYDYRRRYVREYLKKYSDYYISNIDFGGVNGREHYHAIICLDKFDKIPLEHWRYGFSFARQVRVNSDSIDKLSTYVPKLTSHALKKSTGRQFPLIYSRKLIDLIKK